mmetsp:Transcript_15144/g.29082  ORF Transcript_15144/g.29082 Transcript_15144/m.29082 type:complete len:244 (-) Transcript_15144:571-1302(-)
MKVDDDVLHGIIGHGAYTHTSSTSSYRSSSAATPLDTLLSPQGVASLNKWFLAHAQGVCTRPASGSLRSASKVKGLMECDFVALMKKLTDMPDHDLLDLTDVLDTELRGAVGLKELFLVLALLCARAVDQRVKALYLLGPDLYHLLSGDRRGWQAIRLLGLLFELKENALWESRVQLEVPLGATLTFQDFQLLFFASITSASKSDSRQKSLPAQGSREERADTPASLGNKDSSPSSHPSCVIQ